MDYGDELYVVAKVPMRARRVRVRERNVILDTDVRSHQVTGPDGRRGHHLRNEWPLGAGKRKERFSPRAFKEPVLLTLT